MGPGAVAPVAEDRDLDFITGGGEDAVTDADLANGESGFEMNSKDRVDPIEHVLFDEREGAETGFLGGLENEAEFDAKTSGPVEVLRGGLSGAENNRRVAVVPARVHDLGDGGAVIGGFFVLDTKGIHIAAQGDAGGVGRGLAQVEIGDDAESIAENAGLQTCFAQLFRDEASGFKFRAARFGVAMEKPAESDVGFGVFGDLAVDGNPFIGTGLRQGIEHDAKRGE